MIETDRLILRAWRDSDIIPFSEINSDKEVMEYLPKCLSLEETERFYNRIVAEHIAFGYGLYAVETKDEGNFIGYVGFHNFDFDADFSPGVEIGWRLAKKYWNQGYATEAAKACLDYARKHRLFNEIYSFTAVCNHRSERVMQKIGMKRLGLFSHSSLPAGHRLEPHVLYKLDLSQQQTIETDRLVLRRWRTGDAEALYKYASDERVSELALWPRHTSVEMSREIIEKFFIPNLQSFAMVLRDIPDEAIGCIGLVPEGTEHHAIEVGSREVGYWIGYPHWSKGLTSEALNGFIEYCRNKLHLKSLLITTDAQNVVSQRVAEKCGFEFIEDYEFDGIPSKAYRLSLKKNL